MKSFTLNFVLVFFCISSTLLAKAEFPNDSIVAKNKKAKNIILLIGDGMGVTQIYAGYTVNKGSLNLEKFRYTGFSKTYSANNYITDSGAGATAISTGRKTKNGSIAVDTAGKSLQTILEIAKISGMATGLVATSAVTHATPASFIAHNANRNDYEGIALDFLKTDIDVFIGGGKKNFAERKDGQNLIKELIKKGYTVTDTVTDFINLKTNKLAGFTAWEHNPSIINGRGDMLSISAKTAINILSKNDKGFFLMIEGSQIDWGGHNNNIDYVTSELIDFDKVIGDVLDFAKKDGNTLVIVTADHETGGLALNGGDIEAGKVEASFSVNHHTAVMVPVFAFGPGAENFGGIYNNTSLFYKMINSLNVNQEQAELK